MVIVSCFSRMISKSKSAMCDIYAILLTITYDLINLKGSPEGLSALWQGFGAVGLEPTETEVERFTVVRQTKFSNPPHNQQQ